MKEINKRIRATKEKTLYASMVNTDLTEGRGHNYIMAISESKATAERLGKGRNVQGSNARVEKITAYYIPKSNKVSYGTWYVPQGFIHSPTKEDLEEEKRANQEEAKTILLEKFKKGESLTEEERETIVNLIK